MEFQIRAGCTKDIGKDSGHWLFVDIGFSARKRSCGVVKGAGRPQQCTFGELVKLVVGEANTAADQPLHLLLEAPLSAAFNRDGNPTGRSVEKSKDGLTRYWYMGSGALTLIASGYLLRELIKCGVQRDVKLFEGFLSFKPSGAKSSHASDAKKLQKVVWNPTPRSIVPPCKLTVKDDDILKSAHEFTGQDFGVPPVVLA